MKKDKLDLSILTEGQRDAYVKNEEWRKKNPEGSFRRGYIETKTNQSVYNSATRRLSGAAYTPEVKIRKESPSVEQDLNILSIKQKEHYLAVEAARKSNPFGKTTTLCKEVAAKIGEPVNSVIHNYYKAKQKVEGPTRRPIRAGTAKSRSQEKSRNLLKSLYTLATKDPLRPPMQTFIIPEDKNKPSDRVHIIIASVSNLKTILKELEGE